MTAGPAERLVRRLVPPPSTWHVTVPGADRLLEALGRAGFGKVVMPPWYGEPVERGESRLSARQQRRLRRAIDRGNRGNMLRAVAFITADD